MTIPHPLNTPHMVGRVDAESGALTLDRAALAAFFERLHEPDATCRDCFNRLHCAKGCPGSCPVRARHETTDCTIERLVGLADILEHAGYDPVDRAQAPVAFLSGIKVEKLEEEPCLLTA